MKRIVAASLAALIVGTTAIAAAGSAQAAESPTFPVMNTSEQPPDGVWFRYDALDNAHTTRTSGLGVYAGEHVRVKCFAKGAAVGPYGNHIWYYGWDVERPKAPNGQSNEGWLNTHYVNDGMTADHPAGTVAPCSSATGDGGTVATGGGNSSTPANPALIYFSPYDNNGAGKAFKLSATPQAAGVLDLYRSVWSGACVSTKAYPAARSAAGNRPIVTLAGWSAGRAGVNYYLQGASPTEKQGLSYVLLIDPLAYGEAACGDDHAGANLADWLIKNRSARLVILSGKDVGQLQNSRGIQETYLNAIRANQKYYNVDLNGRVAICNYPLSHNDMFWYGEDFIAHRISNTACPVLKGVGGGAPWHPGH